MGDGMHDGRRAPAGRRERRPERPPVAAGAEHRARLRRGPGDGRDDGQPVDLAADADGVHQLDQAGHDGEAGRGGELDHLECERPGSRDVQRRAAAPRRPSGCHHNPRMEPDPLARTCRIPCGRTTR